jgi:hypothetical protein
MRNLLPGILLNNQIDSWNWNVNLSTKLEACVIALHIFAQHGVTSHSLKCFFVMNLCFINSEMQYWYCQQFWSLIATSACTGSVYECPLHDCYTASAPTHLCTISVSLFVFFYVLLTCISIYACNETNLMHYLSSVYSVTTPLHVSSLLVANHQEVTMYICDSWYMLYILVNCWQAWVESNTYQLSCVCSYFLMMGN